MIIMCRAIDIITSAIRKRKRKNVPQEAIMPGVYNGLWEDEPTSISC
jgi:hypothetical protein